jgi:hypothetical protein
MQWQILDVAILLNILQILIDNWQFSVNSNKFYGGSDVD